MKEASDLFDYICNSQWFVDTYKTDLPKEKLPDRRCRHCCRSYKRGPYFNESLFAFSASHGTQLRHLKGMHEYQQTGTTDLSKRQ